MSSRFEYCKSPAAAVVRTTETGFHMRSQMSNVCTRWRRIMPSSDILEIEEKGSQCEEVDMKNLLPECCLVPRTRRVVSHAFCTRARPPASVSAVRPSLGSNLALDPHISTTLPCPLDLRVFSDISHSPILVSTPKSARELRRSTRRCGTTTVQQTCFPRQILRSHLIL